MPVAVTQQEFGVLVPDLMGLLAEDAPSIRLSAAFSPESENVFGRYNMIERMRGQLKELLDVSNDQVKTPDAKTIIQYHLHTNTNSELSLFGATESHIYVWSGSALEWQLRFTTSAVCTHWSIVSFNQKVIATNFVDKVLVWSDSSPGSNFEPLDSASGLDISDGTSFLTQAKYVFVHENRVFVGYTVENGNTLPFRIRACSLGDETDWDVAGSGDPFDKDLVGANFVKGFAQYGSQVKYIIVFTDGNVHQGWEVQDDSVYNWSLLLDNVGLLATDSIVTDKQGLLYFIGSDYAIRELRAGIVSDRIDITIKSINFTYQDFISSTYIDEYDLIWWSIPSGDSATGNNKIISFNPRTKRFSTMTFAIRAFGSYKRQSVFTIDTLPYDSIDGISQPEIDSVENVAGFPLDLASDYSGFTYAAHQAENDRGSEYTGKIVHSTPFNSDLKRFKRLSHLQLYFKTEGSGTVLVEIKRDQEANWQSLGSVDLTDDDAPEFIRRNLYPDLRARDWLIRISGTNRFRYLGLIGTYEPDGDR